MKLTEFYLAQLEREAAPTRHALERVPDGRNDWKPHAKSMQLGYLAALVARMPGWIAMMVNQDELEMKPKGGSDFSPQAQPNAQGLVKLLDESLAQARQALSKTSDDHLMKPWRLLVEGRPVLEDPRYIVITDSVFSHLAHHRGQLTVYLRLLGASVPAIYGPSADEGNF